MKSINLITATFLALWALPSLATDIPSTATVEAQLTSVQEGHYSADYLKKAAVNNLVDQIAAKEATANHEFQCSKVYYQWSSVESESYCGAGSWLTGVGEYCSRTLTMTVNILCDQRDYAQKIAISAEKSCEGEPKPECLTKPYMDLFATIKHTQYFNINKPGDNSSSDNE